MLPLCAARMCSSVCPFSSRSLNMTSWNSSSVTVGSCGAWDRLASLALNKHSHSVRWTDLSAEIKACHSTKASPKGKCLKPLVSLSNKHLRSICAFSIWCTSCIYGNLRFCCRTRTLVLTVFQPPLAPSFSLPFLLPPSSASPPPSSAVLVSSWTCAPLLYWQAPLLTGSLPTVSLSVDVK